MPRLDAATALHVGSSPVTAAYLGAAQVWPAAGGGGGGPDIYGVGFVAESLANMPVGRYGFARAGYRFRADHTGQIASFRIYFIYSDDGSYGDGTGGTVRMSLCAQSGSSLIEPGAVLGFVDAVNPNQPEDEFAVWTFPSPISVTEGNIYFLTFVNTDPDSENNWVSVDAMYHDVPDVPKHPAIKNDADLGCISNYGNDVDWNEEPQYTPILDLYYSDGHVQGQGYMEFEQGEAITVNSSTSAALEFTVSGGDREVDGMYVNASEHTGGPFTLSVRTLAGAVLATSAAVTFPGDYKWGGAAIDPPLTLEDGRSYRLVLSASGASTARLVPIRQGDDYGFTAPTLFDDGVAKVNSGSGWTVPVSDDRDLPMYFTMTGPPAPPLAAFGPVDTFDGPGFASHWAPVGPRASILYGRAVFDLNTDYGSEIGTSDAGPFYTLDEAKITVEVGYTPDGAVTPDVYLWIENPSTFLGQHIVGADLVFDAAAGATQITYDPVAHRWWRIVETGGDLRWQTSPDGRNWTTRRTLAGHGLPLTDMRVFLGAGRSGSNTPTKTATVDYLNALPPAVVASAATTAGTTLAGGAALNMPAGVQAGDLLVAWAANDATGGTGMAISGWTQLFHAQYSGNVVSHGAWAKIATGSDSATLIGASQDYAAVVARIVGHGVSTAILGDIKVGATANGSNAAPNPPNLNAGDEANWLWIASFGADDDDNAATWAPAGYIPLAQVESAQSTSSCMTGVAWRHLVTSSEDPGTFTMAATEEWLANVIAVPRGT